VGFAFQAGWVIGVHSGNRHLRQRWELALCLRQVAGKVGGIDGRVHRQWSTEAELIGELERGREA
jgi:hypothetical protein